MSFGLTTEEIKTRKFFNKSNEEFFKNYTTLKPIKNNVDKISFIENTIFENKYPLKINPYVKILYNYTETENLYNFAINLSTLKLQRINPLRWLLLDKSMGTYDANNNIITYFNIDSIPHELMHLSSTANSSQSGFNLMKTGYNFGIGLNEGYTEMLAQRIFFESDYTKAAYKTNVYLTRIFELLYSTPKEMEKAYFNADYINPLETFIKYGTLKEYKYILKHFDYFATTDIWNNEEIEIFEHLINIIERTKSKEKINEAVSIYDEYIKTEKILKK